MRTNRRKTIAVKRQFLAEIRRLEKFDSDNQKRFASGTSGLTKRQLILLTESIFFAAFRTYEGFLRDLFLLYCLGRKHSSGKHVHSYLQPIDFAHAETLIRSARDFLDWSSPDSVIERAQLYLVDAYPFEIPLSSRIDALRDYKLLRNHIAHDSSESLDKYLKVLKRHLGTIPLTLPSPGEFLLMSHPSGAPKYKLLLFFDTVRAVASDLV